MPGTYPLTAPIVPLTGDSFIGAGSGKGGTELRGDKGVLDRTSLGGLYQHVGDIVSFTLSGACQSGTTCQYADSLFENGRQMVRVLAPCTTTNVTAGAFCIDYSTGSMYNADDPSLASFSYSYVAQAIGAGGGVFVGSLAIDYFASHKGGWPALIVADNSTADSVSVGWSHACGVGVRGSSPVVQNSRLHENGQVGLCSNPSASALLVNTEVDHNNTVGFSTSLAGPGARSSTGAYPPP